MDFIRWTKKKKKGWHLILTRVPYLQLHTDSVQVYELLLKVDSCVEETKKDIVAENTLN